MFENEKVFGGGEMRRRAAVIVSVFFITLFLISSAYADNGKNLPLEGSV
jgi:hypothetical protein